MHQPSAPAVPSQATEKAPMDTARTISEDIDRTLGRRTAPRGTARGRAEDTMKHAGGRLWHGMKKRPSLGVLVVGGLAVLAADAVGVGELALGLAVGYAAYQVLCKGKSVDAAIHDVEEVEKR